MKESGMKNSVGTGLLFLLRQQRYLYYQLRDLAEMQRQPETIDSPELMLEVINGRRKLAEKLREVTDKLAPIKANWGNICGQLGSKYRNKVQKLAEEVRQIIEGIPAAASPETSYPLYEEMNSDNILVGAQHQ
jgi:hypothetical protein